MAGHSATGCRLALTVQAQLDAFVGTGWNLDHNRGLLTHDAPATTFGARVRNDLALAIAPIAQRDVDELTKDRLLHPPHLAAALAARALGGLRARLHAAAVALLAGDVFGQRNLFAAAEDGLFQRQMQVVAEVLTALDPLPRT